MATIFDVKSVEELEIFIKQGGDIHESLREVNALFFDNAQKDVELFKKLMDYGLDPKIKNSENENITHFLLYPHIVPIVAKWANFNDDYPELDILTVAYAHAPNILKELILYGLDIDIQYSEYEETIAFHTNIPDETALLLIENNLNVSNKNIDGQNMLFHTTSLILAQYAIDKGLPVNNRDDYDNTAIMCNTNDDVVKFLIKNGANIHHINDANENILLSRYNNLDMLKFLVKEGINIHIQSPKGRNALMECLEIEEASFLIEQGIDIIDNSEDYSNPAVGEFAVAVLRSKKEKEILSKNLSDIKNKPVNLRI